MGMPFGSRRSRSRGLRRASASAAPTPPRSSRATPNGSHPCTLPRDGPGAAGVEVVARLPVYSGDSRRAMPDAPKSQCRRLHPWPEDRLAFLRASGTLQRPSGKDRVRMQSTLGGGCAGWPRQRRRRDAGRFGLVERRRRDAGGPRQRRRRHARVGGRSGAVQTLFERHFELIFRYAGRRLGRQAAEDVSAEVFLKAFEARGRYDFTYSDARPWLFGIAANVMRRSLRTEGRRLRALAREPLRPAGALDDALVRLDSQATDQRLAAALAALRSDEREALLLVAWADSPTTRSPGARHTGGHGAFTIAPGPRADEQGARWQGARRRRARRVSRGVCRSDRGGSPAAARRGDRGGSPAPRRIGDRAGSAAAARRTHDYDTLMTAPKPVALKEDSRDASI